MNHTSLFLICQILDLRTPNEHVAPQNWSIYYTWKNIWQRFRNNKLEIIAPMWNDEYELPDGSYSVSDVQDYTEHIIKNHDTLRTNPPFQIYINRINKRLVFKTKDGYKVELQAPEIMKLFDWIKKFIGKTKNGKIVPHLEVVEAVLLQCNLVDKQYQRKSKVLYIFASNKSYAYLLNMEPCNLVFLKTYNTDFD